MGDYSAEITETWEQIYYWSKARNLFSDKTISVGIPRSNPYITPANKRQYDCYISVSKDFPQNLGIERIVLSEGKYVLYEFDKPVPYHVLVLMIICGIHGLFASVPL
ncbi:GyrI-like domain-containing protein [Bacillus sp. 2205SS5-2]|uniref:GyrI-like domain-containing protein n=1 Tax=Bacillus sp. 2205SS5-2 TaxID=3109031 RepID=UPI003FA5956A